MDSKDLIDEFKNLFERRKNFYFFHEGYEVDSKYSELNNDQKQWLMKHNYKCIQQEGGGEGGTGDCEVIFMLDNKYFKCTYSYSSYDRYYWECFLSSMREVTPKTVEVVIYD
ncbi:hypothetical protein E6Q11_01425 [Candidatus Dojkabacteria bacterium]|uniref:Uncharacterized protein n=1 Tax=Candidatus Dojkabacteria bacterium TaxID=2099670 RepID=A0A5C7J9S0_9BACT|nr:MAG: hypothetical protein E6Q11_01425 [Candidatus Dojkabacteria bacterium]